MSEEKILGYAVTKELGSNKSDDTPDVYYVLEIVLIGQLCNDDSWSRIKHARVIAEYFSIDECWAYIDAKTGGRDPRMTFFKRPIEISSAGLGPPPPNSNDGPIITLTDQNDFDYKEFMKKYKR